MTLVAERAITLAPDYVATPLLVTGTVHGRPATAAVVSLADVLDQMLRWADEDPHATGHWQLRSDYSDPVTVSARFKPGRVRESHRTAHLFQLLPGVPQGIALTAHCGVTLPIPEAEWLSVGAGMPCEACLCIGMSTGRQLRFSPA